MNAQTSLDDVLEALRGRKTWPLRPEAVFDPNLAAVIDLLDADDAVKAGCHILNDDLPRGFALVQHHEGDKTCDYWRAIVHRREGDFEQAKHWLRMVGRHPVMLRVHDGGPAAAFRFLDRCRNAGSADRAELEAVQRREMLGLLAYARGPAPELER
jgi:hypothetical protein